MDAVVLGPAKTREFRHADDGRGAKVFYVVRVDECDTGRPSLNLSFERMENEIYHDSSFTKVIYPPAVTALKLNFYETLDLIGLFVEASSVHMAAIRKKLYSTSSLRREIILSDCRYNIELGAVNKKISTAGVGRNSERLVLTVTDKENGNEVICVKLKKTKIQFILSAYKTLLEEYTQKLSFPYEDRDGRKMLFVRYGEQVAIGDLWLHGREIQKLQDYVERAIFDFKFITGAGSELFRYRQIVAMFSEIENVAMVKMTKFTEKHVPYIDPDGATSESCFYVTSAFLARLFILLPKFIVVDNKEKEVSEEDGKIQVKKDFGYHTAYADGDFILSSIESQIALSIIKEQTFNAKERKGRLKLQARYRDAIIEDDSYQVAYTSGETGARITVPKLPSVELDLKVDWLYIFALCAESVHSAESMDLDEHGSYSHSWYFSKIMAMGEEKHSIRVYTSKENKAPAVLMIDSIEDSYDGEKNFIAQRMRIPLFREHIRTIIKGMIGLSRQYGDYYWQKKFPTYDEQKDTHEQMTLGIKRFVTAHGKEVVSLGLVGSKENQIIMTDSDRDTLFVSAYNRLMYGRWLQFSGERIAVSFDGYLTDRYNEYKIEFDVEGSNGAKGSLAALAMVFTTVRGAGR